MKKLNWKKIGWWGGGIVAVILLIVLLGALNPDAPEKEDSVDVVPKKVQTINFGTWKPDGDREITGTFETDADVTVRAKVGGTIGSVYARIGDDVRAGEVLAEFARNNDATQISYENIVQQLAVTRAQAASSVLSAETALATAERGLEQTRSTEDQNYSRAFEQLRSKTRAAETTFFNAVEWTDTIIGESRTARSQRTAVADQIGSNSSVLKQTVRNQVGELLLRRDTLENERLPRTMTDAQIVEYAESRLSLLRASQVMLRNMDTLIRRTTTHSGFSETTKSTYAAQVDGQIAAINGETLALENQIEAAKSERGRNQLSVLSTENAVQNTRANLELVRAQTAAQISQLETQLRLAQKSRDDLSVRAPFTGTITSVDIDAFDQVSAGAGLFGVVASDARPKISANLTADEISRLSAVHAPARVRFVDGAIVTLSEYSVSGRVDPITQKIAVEFPLDEAPSGERVGTFVRLLLPAGNGSSNLVPISAISFEPDGAEVLVVTDGVAARQKVKTGTIISDAIEVTAGLEINTAVVQYRNRAHAGEKLETEN